MPPIDSGRVTIFGAGGPVAASAAAWLAPHYLLRLTDAVPLQQTAEEARPQSEGAPVARPLHDPHETMVVDITDYRRVLEAARGAEALINCSVLRHDPARAFAVNCLGAWNVVRAAAELGIRRIIHTGPFHLSVNQNADYAWDSPVGPDIPLRPGSNLYATSKYLGGEVTRLVAIEHRIEVFTLLYCHFMPAGGGDRPDGSGCGPFVTSWEEAGEAFLHALRAPSPPQYYEPLLICATMPHGRYDTAKNLRLLGWTPQDRFERLWRLPSR